jgi:signal recognition particle subunit SRP54
VSDVNNLVNRFTQARQMMRQMGGAMGPMPGGLPRGTGRPKPVQQARKKKSGSKVSGNPAKRVSAPGDPAVPPAVSPTSGAAFGLSALGAAGATPDPGAFELPPELQRLLDPPGPRGA